MTLTKCIIFALLICAAATLSVNNIADVNGNFEAVEGEDTRARLANASGYDAGIAAHTGTLRPMQAWSTCADFIFTCTLINTSMLNSVVRFVFEKWLNFPINAANYWKVPKSLKNDPLSEKRVVPSHLAFEL